MARPRTKPLPTFEEIQRYFTYDPETGEIRVREREGTDPYILSYNRRRAGLRVGTTMNTGYCFIRVPGGHGMHLGHRLAWLLHYGEWPATEIDHRDGNKLNNRIDNLRLATREQNCANRPSRNPTGLKGVVKAHRGGRWEARIRVNRARLYLGSFDTPQEAHAAYVTAARLHLGEFANTDVIMFGSINAMINITAMAA